VVDIVGFYLNPPDKAVVLCVDEKSQIQVLDHTQPGLPMKKGRAQTMTHDYKRNGTMTLFAVTTYTPTRLRLPFSQRTTHFRASFNSQAVG
jgi:hypothetical protein